jgi:hypothetical protein
MQSIAPHTGTEQRPPVPLCMLDVLFHHGQGATHCIACMISYGGWICFFQALGVGDVLTFSLLDSDATQDVLTCNVPEVPVGFLHPSIHHLINHQLFHPCISIHMRIHTFTYIHTSSFPAPAPDRTRSREKLFFSTKYALEFQTLNPKP